MSEEGEGEASVPAGSPWGGFFQPLWRDSLKYVAVAVEKKCGYVSALLLSIHAGETMDWVYPGF